MYDTENCQDCGLPIDGCDYGLNICERCTKPLSEKDDAHYDRIAKLNETEIIGEPEWSEISEKQVEKCNSAYGNKTVMVHLDTAGKKCCESCHFLIDGLSYVYTCVFTGLEQEYETDVLFHHCPFSHLGSGVYELKMVATKQP